MSASDNRCLAIGHCTAELIENGGGGPGLGEVRCGDHILRSGERPMFVQIRNPWGVELCDFQLAETSALSDGGVALEFCMSRRDGGRMEWMCHEVRSRVNTTDWSRPPQAAVETGLTLELRPVARQLGPFKLDGFSYRYRYRSPDIPIYLIFDRGTWEIGGDVNGNTLWLPQGHGPSVYLFDDARQQYSTEWYLPTICQPNIFQFMPFQTGMQGFTLLSHDDGALITWATAAAHIRTLIEKRRGEDVLPHFHEHCGDLAGDFATAPMEVLFCAGSFNRVDVLNLHHEVRELVHETLHEQVGMRRERITTYGVMGNGVVPDLQHYRRRGLPKLIEAGCRTVMLSNQFENDMNVYGLANACCTVDLKVAETVGEDNLRDFCRDANENGVVVEMWGNTSISTTTERFSHRNGKAQRIDFLPLDGSIMDVLKEDPQAFVRNPAGAIEADHYTPRFCVMNLRRETVRNYWMKQWTYAYEKIGLRGIFLDSSFNLSSDKFHWLYNAGGGAQRGATDDQVTDPAHARPTPEPPSQILSQYHAHLSLMAAMQRVGYVYSGEDRGVFGLSRSGTSGAQRADTLPMWADTFCEFDADRIRAEGRQPDDVFFQALAYRMMWYLYWDPVSDDLSWSQKTKKADAERPSAWQLRQLKIFNEVETHMRRRTILPAESGVLYADGDVRVLWSFGEFVHRAAQTESINDVTTGETKSATTIAALPRHVYTWQVTPALAAREHSINPARK